MKLTKALKFRVHSPEHSEAIQEKLFTFVGEEGLITGKKFLYVDPTSFQPRITHSSESDPEYFNSHPHKEATLDDLYDPEFLKPEEVCQAKSIVIDGKKYKLVLDE